MYPHPRLPLLLCFLAPPSTSAQVSGPLTIYGPGTNHLPLVHVADAASYLSALSAPEALSSIPEAQQYLLVTDTAAPGQPGGAQQGEMVQAISTKLGVGDVQ